MYLDYAATTPLTPQVKDYMVSLLDTYQNPSSMYQSGVEAKKIITTARNNVAKLINADSKDIIFTSGGSANNTLFIKGYTNKHHCMVLYSPTSHKSVLKCVDSLKYKCPLRVDHTGKIDFQDLKECLSMNPMKKLVIIEYANSEIGTIQDVQQVINICHLYNAIVYVDCTGSISQIPVDVKRLNVDGLGFSAHKLGALKGTGVLYKKSSIELEPLIYGSQEQGLFSGTENVIGIAALGKAVENYNYSSVTSDSRDYVYDFIINNIADSHIIGTNINDRLPHNLYVCFEGIEGESLMILLDMADIQVSTGSACTSGDLTPSSTLTAIGLDEKLIHSGIRMTFSGYETKDELDYLCSNLQRCVEVLRQLNK
jgi:cysteine desulfurase|uniref:NifS-like protein n=1 Tax=Siphoviridae sp. cttFh17 TaxID=2826491 RepID=A0A8S5NHW3_9CAUD|nr:MAG TPA: cysteine desulfurase [Siphoviridae sp. cttFh17]